MTLKNPSALLDATFLPQFNFNLPENVANEFNDLDPLTEAENINVNKLINDLEDQPADALLPTTDALLPSTDAAVLEIQSTDFENIDLNALPDFSGQFRDIAVPLKYNPSRSVPSTPLPMVKIKNDIEIQGHSSRSYPSTPLLVSESFTYNHSHDFLLNGQPVKEKECINLEQDISMIQENAVVNSDIYGLGLYGINGVMSMNNEVESKGYGFERQNGNGHLEGTCVILQGEQNNYDGMNGA